MVNFSHGSLCMLGAYIGWSILTRIPHDPIWFTAGLLLTALATGVIGILIETLLLRRIYRAPELFQLLATFGVVLMIQDVTLRLWGPNDLALPRPPWLRSVVYLGDSRFPVFDLVLIGVGPLILALLWLLFTRTRWGTLVRAATQDREMVAALGVDQRWLFTSVFALGAALAGLGGALGLPSGSANLGIDLGVITDAFVVVVVGGLGSLPGAYLAALLIALLQSFGIAIIPQATLVLVFVVMAVVLVFRPNGLLGRPQAPARAMADAVPVIRPAPQALRWLGAAALALAAAAPLFLGAYGLSIATEALILILFAASLHFMMGPGGMPSFGHAAWFGIGAYAAALLVHGLAAPLPAALLAAPLAAGLAAFLFGSFVVRLSGVYLAMLTLAFAQIVWAIAFQSVAWTGGDNGILGVWPGPYAPTPAAFYWLTLTLAAAGTLLLRRILYAPLGYAIRATRDSALRAEAIGLPTQRLRLAAFTLAGTAAGLAGGLYAYAKGSVFPTYISIPKSIDALLMVLLGGIGTITGPIRRRHRLCRPLRLPPPLHRPLALRPRRHDRPFGRALPRGHCRRRPTRLDVLPSARLFPLTMTAVLRVAHLSKSFGGVAAVQNVGFDVAVGEMLALIGPNGAGKSTCFNMVGGQLRPDRGTVTLGGQPITGLPPRKVWARGVGRTFQITATFASMTVRENVQMALIAAAKGLAAWWRPARTQYVAEADALLDQVGLTAQAERGAGVLAYGDLKRLELAVALSNQPTLLLMDEPTAGMAPAERVALMALTRRLATERGLAVLFTEHDMDVVFATSDRILVLARGILIAQGPPAAIRADPAVREVYLGTGATSGGH